ncbi:MULTISPECIES: N,N-dimethylformamidase beta subunit family domain-containing protein [unclassified Bradyrhizobium]|uniref:N,N-dimethylformamidase beta subunit family domain-containing protein n=1 Tax=unclassified Bradyrhizobium TaxID=2631580 RepID=UPI0028EE4009|nr:MULTISPECIES: N,N-dimethylformamidase beta subunit family domain-containing protein [unclassified Bradyrhizobium]
MAEKKLYGYCDPWTVKQGETLSFMISAEGTDTVDVRLVRLVHGDEHPDGPGFLEEEVDCEIPATLNVRRQFTQVGAHAVVEDISRRLVPAGDFTVYGFIFPTRPGGSRQAILSNWDIMSGKGYGIGINTEGRLEFWVGNGELIDHVTAEVPLRPRAWYFVAATFNAATLEARLHQIGVVNRYNSLLGLVVPIDYDSRVAETFRVMPQAPDESVPFLWAGASEENDRRGRFVGMLYSGKIDRPGILNTALPPEAIAALAQGELPSTDAIIARWDTSAGYTDRGIGDTITDVGPHGLHAHGVNRPVRGMTGWNWAGREDSFRLDPNQYGGIAFRDDALTDCRWSPTVTLRIPNDLRSGVYALRLRAGESEDHIPFFVRAATPRAPLAVLMSTFTYLAYANERLGFDAPIAQAITAHTPIFSEADIDFYKLQEFGLSTYDHHSDGSGCCYSSWRRPIINMRPRHRNAATGVTWGLPADLSLLWWLQQAGYDFEILTDHDLHAEGAAALHPYRAVINCTHPEYYSERMMDGTEDYLRAGGRLIYAGGNGYYWVSGLREDEPHCMEVRKLDNGSRAWQADPGEAYLVSTGERSGLWRSRGRAPQKLVGVGFTSEGMDESQPFERMPDSFHRLIAWMFEGIGDREEIGNFGLGLGGAAGIEIDRYDLALGTPPHTLLVASSHGHSDNYPLVSEEITYAFPGRGGTQDPLVRADMTYFTTGSNGACLSIGSIAWSQALPVRGGDNNVATIMRNVLTAFLRPGPLPGSEFVGEEKLWR